MIIPEALRRQKPTVYLILDNGTTHAPKQLEHWLQQLPVVQEGKLTFQVFWLPPNASWLDQIEIWFRDSICYCFTDMDEKKKLRKTTVYLPQELIDDLKATAKQHYRSCNGELMFAIEQYLLSSKHTMK